MKSLKIKKIIITGLTVILTGYINTSPILAQSLWSDQSPAANIYADHKARAVGDIITIVISETSSAVRAGKTNNSKSADVQASAGSGIFKWISSASAGSSDKVNTSGSVSNTNVVKARMTAQVVAVKPNGNLLISGNQSIKQNKEEQKITITGEIRPQDIAADNTVLSSYVANAQIKINGHGPIAAKQRQGFLTQIFNFLF